MFELTTGPIRFLPFLCHLSHALEISTNIFARHVPLFQQNSFSFPALSLSPTSFKIPHSVSLDEKNQELYVADRENGRILVFNALNGKLRRALAGKFNTIYAISYKGTQS